MKKILVILIVISGNLMGFDYIDYAYTLSNKYCKEAKKDDMSFTGIGGGFRGGVNKISLSANVKKNLNLNEARKFYLKQVNMLLSIINSDKKIRPYLRNYPATLNDIKLSISFFRTSHLRVCQPYISIVFNHGNTICYSKYDQQMERFIDKEKHRETFEEACRIVFGDGECEK